MLDDFTENPKKMLQNALQNSVNSISKQDESKMHFAMPVKEEPRFAMPVNEAPRNNNQTFFGMPVNKGPTTTPLFNAMQNGTLSPVYKPMLDAFNATPYEQIQNSLKSLAPRDKNQMYFDMPSMDKGIEVSDMEAEQNAKRTNLEDLAYRLGYALAPSEPNSMVGFMPYNFSKLAQGTIGLGENPIDLGVSLLNELGSAVTSFGGATPNNVSQWFDAGAQYPYDLDVAGSFGQGIADKHNGNISELTKSLGEIYQLIPSIIGGIKIGKLLSSLAGVDAGNATKILSGIQAVGGKTQEAYSEGATLEQAQLYGALEFATDNIVDCTPSYKKKLTRKLFSKFKNVPGALKGLNNILDEGGKSAVSAYISPYLQRATYYPEFENATFEELARNFASGAALSRFN